MSADNYMLVEKEGEEFLVWNCSASAESHPSEYTDPEYRSTDVLEAINYAHDQYTEYGVTLSDDVREEMSVRTLRLQEAKLTNFAWKQSDKADTSVERDHWSFIASNAPVIVRAITRGEK